MLGKNNQGTRVETNVVMKEFRLQLSWGLRMDGTSTESAKEELSRQRRASTEAQRWQRGDWLILKYRIKLACLKKMIISSIDNTNRGRKQSALSFHQWRCNLLLPLGGQVSNMYLKILDFFPLFDPSYSSFKNLS